MIRFDCLFVFVAVFQVIASQGPRGPRENIPDKCRGPPPDVKNPEQCCQMPAMWTDDELVNCGLKKAGDGDFRPPPGPPDCSKPICLMETKYMLDEDKNVKFDVVADYLEKWAGDSDFKAPVEMAKAICLQDGNVPGPEHICIHARLMHCMAGLLFVNCPDANWQKTDNCQALKNHMEECKAPFQH